MDLLREGTITITIIVFVYVTQSCLVLSTGKTDDLNEWGSRPLNVLNVRPKRQVVEEGGDNCGADNFCSTDLGLTGRYLLHGTDGVYIVGGSRRLPLLANISNAGELAMGVRLAVTYDPALVFVRVERVETAGARLRDTRLVRCDTAVFGRVLCHVAAPIPRGGYVAIELLMDAAMIGSGGGGGRDVLVSMNVTSRSNEETNPADNHITLPALTVLSKADIRISGLSDPAAVQRGVEDEVSVIFRVTNAGPSDADMASVYIYVPDIYTTSDTALSTLPGLPQILDTDVQCDFIRTTQKVHLYRANSDDPDERLSCDMKNVRCKVFRCLISSGIDKSIDSIIISLNSLRIHINDILLIEEYSNMEEVLYTVSAEVILSNDSKAVDVEQDNNVVNVDISVDLREPKAVDNLSYKSMTDKNKATISNNHNLSMITFSIVIVLMTKLLHQHY